MVLSVTALRFFSVKMFTFFPRRFAARSLWLRVLRRFLAPPAASMPKSRAASATGMWRSLTLVILCTLLARPLRLLTIVDLLLLRSELRVFYNSSRDLPGDTADGAGDIILTVCHRTWS